MKKKIGFIKSKIKYIYYLNNKFIGCHFLKEYPSNTRSLWIFKSGILIDIVLSFVFHFMIRFEVLFLKFPNFSSRRFSPSFSLLLDSKTLFSLDASPTIHMLIPNQDRLVCLLLRITMCKPSLLSHLLVPFLTLSCRQKFCIELHMY